VSRDPSEIIFYAQKTCIIIINVENSCAAKYVYFYEEKLKRTAFI